jgi:hypothetical protein
LATGLGERIHIFRKREPNENREQVALLPISGGYPRSLVIANGMVYVTHPENGALMRVPVDGGEPTVIATQQPYIDFLAADDEFIYWLTNARLMRLVQ